MPGARRATSWVPTLPASSSVPMSTKVSTCCSTASFSPGSTWRLATMPAIGAIRLASRCATSVVASAAWAAASAARAVSRVARELSSAVPEMKFCSAKRSLLAWLRSACSKVARADSRLAPRSAIRLPRSAMSMRPSNWPARTLAPSTTSRLSKVPEALERSTAVLGATSGPENSMSCGRLTRLGRSTSLARKSSGADAAASGDLAACAEPADPRCFNQTAPPANAANTARLAAISQLLRIDFSFMVLPATGKRAAV